MLLNNKKRNKSLPSSVMEKLKNRNASKDEIAKAIRDNNKKKGT